MTPRDHKFFADDDASPSRLDPYTKAAAEPQAEETRTPMHQRQSPVRHRPWHRASRPRLRHDPSSVAFRVSARLGHEVAPPVRKILFQAQETDRPTPPSSQFPAAQIQERRPAAFRYRTRPRRTRRPFPRPSSDAEYIPREDPEHSAPLGRHSSRFYGQKRQPPAREPEPSELVVVLFDEMISIPFARSSAIDTFVAEKHN